MPLSLEITDLSWEMTEPFAISRGTMTHVDGILVTLTDAHGVTGRGEAYGIIYEGETPQTIRTQIEAVRAHIERGVDREKLADFLGIGGARCAVDCALWDLEAKRSGAGAFKAAGLGELKPVHTAFTIGMRPLPEVTATAAKYADFALLKVKVDAQNPIEIIEAVREGAPNSDLIIDPNQSWSIEMLTELEDDLVRLGVVLLEQPLPVGADDGLVGYSYPIAICADELVHDRSDLAKVAGKYQVVNIKLDKSGGLTEGMALARAAREQGYRLMVGCMAGSSLSMAPAMLVAQLCDFVDLDGPLLQKEDWPFAMQYKDGLLSPPRPELWG